MMPVRTVIRKLLSTATQPRAEAGKTDVDGVVTNAR
jgi:hypothetical protein